MTKQISLTRGKYALVDDEDFEWLSQWKWHYSDTGYAVRTQHTPMIKGKRTRKNFRMHRVILASPIGFEIDHINGNPLDNRRDNLRVCNSAQNKFNSKSRLKSTSKYKGVCWVTRDHKWMAQIQKNGINKRIGFFNTEIEAAKAYNNFAKEYFGEFAKLNEIFV